MQEGEDDNDMDANEPPENNTLTNDEESEHTMLLGRVVNQQQYKGNMISSTILSIPNNNFTHALTVCFFCLIFMYLSVVLMYTILYLTGFYVVLLT